MVAEIAGFSGIEADPKVDKRRKIFWLAAGVIAVAWFFRYQITGADRFAYRLDRWTGEVSLCTPSGCQ